MDAAQRHILGKYLEQCPQDEFKALWALYGALLTAEFVAKWPGQRPVAWWRSKGFSRDVPRQDPRAIPVGQTAWLREHDELTAAEIAVLDARNGPLERTIEGQ